MRSAFQATTQIHSTLMRVYVCDSHWCMYATDDSMSAVWGCTLQIMRRIDNAHFFLVFFFIFFDTFELRYVCRSVCVCKALLA